MKRNPILILVIITWLSLIAFLSAGAQTKSVTVPKIWDSKQLAAWATPLASLGIAANFYSEEEYYATPVDNVRTYPVYARDKEPKGYREWMLKQGPQRLIEPEKLKTESDWIDAGQNDPIAGGSDAPSRSDDLGPWPEGMK